MTDEWTSPDGSIRLICGDCLEVLPTIEAGSVDAVVTDPPYGIGIARRGTLGSNNAATVKDYGKASWDDTPCKPEAIKAMLACSRWQIIFGGNFFELPPSSCWLVWDKRTTGDYADCELAWTNLPKAVRRLEWLWNGMIRKGDDVRVHPTQKPVGVMQWCIEHLPSTTATIIDPFMGSGSTIVAAARLGRRAIGIEIDPHYFAIARDRIIAELSRQPLFKEPTSKQVELFGEST